MSASTIAVIVVVAFMIGLSKGGLGGPVLVALVAPVLSQIMPVSQAVGLTLPLLLVGDLMALIAYWRAWDMGYIRLMLPPAIIGVAFGIALLTTLDDKALRLALGLFSVLIVVYKVGSDRLKALAYSPREWHGVLAGWASGFGSALANVGAPPFIAYMLLQKVDPRPFIGTTTLLFSVINVLKLPIFLATGVLTAQGAISVAWAMLIIPPTVLFGSWAVKHFTPQAFEALMTVLLFIGGLYLIGQGIG
jgi:uncharacterized membrane protein YfcA